MLLKCCLLNIGISWPSYGIFGKFCVHVYVWVYQSYLFFIIIFIFIAINHIISLKLSHLFIWTFLSKVQPQGVAYSFCLIFAYFSLPLLIKVLLIKKGVILNKVDQYSRRNKVVVHGIPSSVKKRDSWKINV